MHKVTGHIDTNTSARQRAGTQNIAHVQLEPLPGQRTSTRATGVADKAAHVVAALAQPAGKAAADEAAGAGHEQVHVSLRLAHPAAPGQVIRHAGRVSAFAERRTTGRMINALRLVVVGSGIAGLSTACRLNEQGHVVAVMDKRRLVLTGEAIGGSHVQGAFPSGPAAAGAVAGTDR